jgi:hypothetical protein
MFSLKFFIFLQKFSVKMLLMDPDPGGPKTYEDPADPVPDPDPQHCCILKSIQYKETFQCPEGPNCPFT